MREILFRGKEIDTKQWIDGSLITEGPFGEFVRIFPYSLYLTESLTQFHYVIPETVGQYIGRKDKNDNLIFEADIVKFTSSPFKLSSIGVVCFHDGSYCIKYLSYGVEGFHQIGKPDEQNDMGAIYIVTYEYEIIGNIHDNPELLF